MKNIAELNSREITMVTGSGLFDFLLYRVPVPDGAEEALVASIIVVVVSYDLIDYFAPGWIEMISSNQIST